MTDKDTEMKAPGAKAGAGPVVVHIANNTDTPVEFCPHCGGILTPQAPPEPDRCSRCGEAKPIHKVKFEDDRERIVRYQCSDGARHGEYIGGIAGCLPNNDPLWFDPCWTVTPTQSTSCATMGSSSTTYVVGRSALTAGTGTWQSVSVVIPPYTESRKLIARVIGVNNTAASGNFYADIDTLEKVLLKKKRIFI